MKQPYFSEVYVYEDFRLMMTGPCDGGEAHVVIPLLGRDSATGQISVEALACLTCTFITPVKSGFVDVDNCVFQAVPVPPAGPELHLKVRHAFVGQGSSLNRWCTENNVFHQNAVAALKGSWDGPKGVEMRERIVAAAGIDRKPLIVKSKWVDEVATADGFAATKD